MKFDVVFNSVGARKFKRILYLNGDSCIQGTPKGSDMDNNISVIYPGNREIITYPSIEPGEVLYPVNVGNCIIVNEKVNGTLYSNAYRVIEITDTEVIGGPI